MYGVLHGQQSGDCGINRRSARVYFMLHLPPTAISMPHFSLTEPYLLPSGNNWVGYWTSEAKSTRQRFANASEWGLSPPRPRGAGHRTKLLGVYHVAHSTSVRLIRGNQRRADASMCLSPTYCTNARRRDRHRPCIGQVLNDSSCTNLRIVGTTFPSFRGLRCLRKPFLQQLGGGKNSGGWTWRTTS